MRGRNEKLVLLFGCLSCLAVASVNADGKLIFMMLAQAICNKNGLK